MTSTCRAEGHSALASRYLLIGDPDVPREIRDALVTGRNRDAALLLVSQFGLSMRDACELVK